MPIPSTMAMLLAKGKYQLVERPQRIQPDACNYIIRIDFSESPNGFNIFHAQILGTIYDIHYDETTKIGLACIRCDGPKEIDRIVRDLTIKGKVMVLLHHRIYTDDEFYSYLPMKHPKAVSRWRVAMDVLAELKECYWVVMIFITLGVGVYHSPFVLHVFNAFALYTLVLSQIDKRMNA